MKTCDVAVFGAGIVGAACAYELASAGLRVALLEPNAIGSSGTGSAYGSLSIAHDVPGKFELTRYGLQLWSKLANYLPTECEYKRGGSISLARNDAEMKDAMKNAEFFMRQGLDVDLLTGSELAELERGLRGDLAGGLYVAENGWLRLSRAAEFLVQAAARSGAETITQQVTAIAEHEVTLADGSILHAGNIVSAAGRHASHLTPGLPLELSKGHLMVVETEGDSIRHAISIMTPEFEPAAEASVRLEVRQGELGANRRREIWIGSSYQSVSSEKAGDLVGTQVEPE